MIVVIVEGLVWEVLSGALFAELMRFHSWNHIIRFDWVDEHVLFEFDVVEKIDENSVIINEAASHIRITKSCHWNRMVVQFQQRIWIYVKVTAFHIDIADLLAVLLIVACTIRVRFFAEMSQPEAAVIHVGNAVMVAVEVLLNVFHLDISASVVLFEGQFVIVLQAILLDNVMHIVVLGAGYDPTAVIRYDNTDNIVLGLN